MKIEDLQAHCVEQMRKLPRGSKMYEEHLLTLSIIDTNKKYFNEIDKLNKMIDLILDKFKEGTEYYYSEFDYMDKEQLKQYFEELAERKSEEWKKI